MLWLNKNNCVQKSHLSRSIMVLEFTTTNIALGTSAFRVLLLVVLLGRQAGCWV